MQFDWDDDKNEANVLKHGLDFEDAAEVFDGPVLRRRDTREGYGEERWVGLGLLGRFVVAVVFTLREPDIIRIISMRKATQDERNKFQDALQNELGFS